MALLIALLDKPSEDSLGMVPAVVKESDKTIRVLGLAPTSAHRAKGLHERDVKDLIAGGHALGIEDTHVKDRLADDTAALWLGHEFQDVATEVGVAFAPPPQRPVIAFKGKIFLLPSPVAYRHIEDWVVGAFKTFRSLLPRPIGGGDVSDRPRRLKIADLLSWALPERPEALAASWAVSPDPEHELKWQIRTMRHGVDSSELQKLHEAILKLDV